jgi:hypothetical protein
MESAGPPDPEGEYVVMGSCLPLRSQAHVPEFLLAAAEIRRQLAVTEGLIGYALDAQLVGKTSGRSGLGPARIYWNGLGDFSRIPFEWGLSAETCANPPSSSGSPRVGIHFIHWADVRDRIKAEQGGPPQL